MKSLKIPEPGKPHLSKMVLEQLWKSSTTSRAPKKKVTSAGLRSKIDAKTRDKILKRVKEELK